MRKKIGRVDILMLDIPVFNYDIDSFIQKTNLTSFSSISSFFPLLLTFVFSLVFVISSVDTFEFDSKQARPKHRIHSCEPAAAPRHIHTAPSRLLRPFPLTTTGQQSCLHCIMSFLFYFISLLWILLSITFWSPYVPICQFFPVFLLLPSRYHSSLLF